MPSYGVSHASNYLEMVANVSHLCSVHHVVPTKILFDQLKSASYIVYGGSNSFVLIPVVIKIHVSNTSPLKHTKISRISIQLLLEHR